MKKLGWGQTWSHIILKHIEHMSEVVPGELAKEFQGINAFKIAYILHNHGWQKHHPIHTRTKNEMSYTPVKYTR